MSPGRGKHAIRTLLAALLLAGALPAAADTALQPYVSDAGVSTLSLAWNASGPTRVAALSTDPTFTSVISSGQLTGNTTAYSGLSAYATHYFRVKLLSEPDSAYSLNGVSISTEAFAPLALAIDASRFAAGASSVSAVAGLSWNKSANPDWMTYEVRYADNAGFSQPGTGYYQLSAPSVGVGGLKANTTYYFQVRARSFRGGYTAYDGPVSSSTLAMALSNLAETPGETTAAISWTPLSGGVQAQTSEGYKVIYAPNEGLAGASAWTTASAAAGSAPLSSLSRNTRYYYRAGALNWSGTANYSETRSFTTLPAQLQNLARLAAGAWSATLGWSAVPASPQAASAAGYRLEASTTNFSGGTVVSSATYDISKSTLTVTLDSNTTYYFRAGSLNADGGATYTATLATATLAAPVEALLTTLTPSPLGITAAFSPLPDSPPALTCEGYLLEASTAPFGSGGTVLSSASYSSAQSQLTVSGLVPNTLYYLRLGTLNWTRTPNYTDLGSQATLLPENFPTALLKGVWQSSAAVSFARGSQNPDSFVAEVSTYPFFTSVLASSATASVAVTTLTFTGLPHNTGLYFRVGALFNGGTVYLNIDQSYGYTLPKTMTGQALAGVFYSSMAVSWDQMASTDTDHFLLEASTAQSFTGEILFSSTSETSSTGLYVEGLAPDTSYYLRAAAVNEEGGAVYRLFSATSTLATRPAEGPFTITPNTLSASWTTSPANPADTRYVAEISPGAGFAQVTGTTVTANSALFSGLASNTPYWVRVTAVNRLNRRSPAVTFNSSYTAANFPLTSPKAPDLGVSSITFHWTPNNPDGNLFRAWISSSPTFAFVHSSSDTSRSTVTVEGLQSDTSYYFRVSALNYAGVPTDPPTDLAVRLTRPATPQILVPTETFKSFMTDGFTVSWGANGNSGLTVYEVELSTRSDFAVMNSSRVAVSTTGVQFTGLPLNTTYWMQVRAWGQNGQRTLFVSTGMARTLGELQMNAVAQIDNTITLNTSYGPITAYLPRGSIGSSTRITLTPLFPATYTFPPAVSPVASLTGTGIGLEVAHSPPTLVWDAITLTLSYDPVLLAPGTDRTKLLLALYDVPNGVWIPLPSESDTANNRVVARTWHLSTFQIMIGASQTSLADVKIYPNPYRPNSTASAVNFTNMPPLARVSVYTFAGELVRKLRADVNGMTSWDGLNSAGLKAASGVYIVLVQTSDRKHSRTFKIAVER